MLRLCATPSIFHCLSHNQVSKKYAHVGDDVDTISDKTHSFQASFHKRCKTFIYRPKNRTLMLYQ